MFSPQRWVRIEVTEGGQVWFQIGCNSFVRSLSAPVHPSSRHHTGFLTNFFPVTMMNRKIRGSIIQPHLLVDTRTTKEHRLPRLPLQLQQQQPLQFRLQPEPTLDRQQPQQPRNLQQPQKPQQPQQPHPQPHILIHFQMVFHFFRRKGKRMLLSP